MSVILRGGKWFLPLRTPSMPEPLASPPPDQPGYQPAAAGTGPTPQQLKTALKAFKKRLKLTRLDDESRLGHGALSSGGPSGIVAITPPAQFPQAVWNELVRQGKLRRAGQGMYELAAE
jgi:hypothetical protein